jgi:hypothetical protein
MPEYREGPEAKEKFEKTMPGSLSRSKAESEKAAQSCYRPQKRYLTIRFDHLWRVTRT